MTSMALAATLFGPEDLRMVERPLDPLAPGMVRIRFGAGGICGSDMHYYRHARTGDFVVTSPLVLGHEIAGEVFRFSLDANGGFDFWCPVEIASDTIFEVRLRCDAEFNASRAGQGGDERDLAYHLNAMELSHEAGPGTSGDVERRSGR